MRNQAATLSPATLSEHSAPPPLTCVEICAGGGGQSLGLEQAGFQHRYLLELDRDACSTLKANRPAWQVVESDLRAPVPPSVLRSAHQVDLLAGGVPCPPFSLAGRQLGSADERNLFPAALTLVELLRPRAVLIENVKGLLQSKFSQYRAEILSSLHSLGYRSSWRLLRACDFGVPQLRPRAVLVAMPSESFDRYRWPAPSHQPHQYLTVGQALHKSMASQGWELAAAWAAGADQIAPTLCGGSRKHGGPDLGPSRAREAWARLGVKGTSVADRPPAIGDRLPIRLTVEQLAVLQGFPADWHFVGTKTSRYRQIGNAFPPPVAKAVGACIAAALAQAP
ncbi:DNA cytosine methyltransferase [Kitasatospora sp. McL0602]|uniref:DNA cytosine methyltransferase n=1 Tax=Kitasatospora sp. McL0602 TaxID=3439530 RepID=UPI003F8BE673